jgi:F-type H+-transporting ATPase subunit b
MKRFFAAALLLAGLLTVSVPSHALMTFAQDTPAAASSGQGGNQSALAEEEKDENAGFRHSASVQYVGRKLGLSPEQASKAFEWLNFGLLALGVGWFLAKALPKTFRNRNTAIQKYLVDARTATEEANARLSGVEERLGKLDGQIAAMREQSEKDAAAEEQRIKASVVEETQKILLSAEQEIAAATVQARKQIQQYAAELAIDQAAKKLVVSAETDRLLVQNFARRLTGDDSKEGQN